MERIRKSYGFGNGIDIGADGSKGGLSLGWKEEDNGLRGRKEGCQVITLERDSTGAWQIPDGKVEGQNLARPFYFKFNVDWVLDENFEEQVIEGWSAFMGDIPEKLSMLGTNLSRWASKNKA
ncbi:hypothetical protein J1N35_043898 [Gossypium stocksii]|uniref:Uncharacterized protein n=1 Tax=Gossypium stocksii TaxID=47602 RepID=A0A9D3U8C2_9ROSI|nr:hypothetical protein J1N35_043898 [Gossypium stocksii]